MHWLFSMNGLISFAGMIGNAILQISAPKPLLQIVAPLPLKQIIAPLPKLQITKPKKTILKRVINGIVSGWNMPIFSDKVAKFDSNIYVKLFKPIGALSTYFILSGLGLKSYPLYFYIGIAFSLPFVIYRIVLVFFIIKQYISNLKNGKHLIKNSPLDKFQTIFKLTMNSLKIISNVTVGTGNTVALMSELDVFNTFYGLNSDGTARQTISQMSLDALRSFDCYSNTGYEIKNMSDFFKIYDHTKYKLTYDKINGVNQYFFLNSKNEIYAMINKDLQSSVEYIDKFQWR